MLVCLVIFLLCFTHVLNAIFQFNAKGMFGLTISRYPLATRMTLTSEKDLRISPRVVVVKVKTF